MLTHADLHLVVGDLGDLGAVLRVGGGLDRHGEGGHVVVEAFGNGVDFVEALSGFGGGAGDLVQGHAADQAATVLDGGVGAGGDVFVGQDHLDVEAGLFGHFHRHVAVQHVACVVQHDEQDARRAVQQLHRFEDLGPVGGGEDVADDADVDHALAHEPLQCRLVSRPAEGQDGDLVFGLRLGRTDHLLADERDLVREGRAQAVQEFRGQVVGVVDELLHSHGVRLSG